MPEAAVAAAQETLRSGQLAQGARVRAFEEALGAWVGNPHVAAVSDRSGALTLALTLAGVRPGDEVIASPLSCVATTMPIANLGARPVWCDVDPSTGMINPAGIAPRVTERTRAVVVYHWGGDVADLDRIAEAARRHGLTVIDDASAAFGAEFRGRRLGNTGTDFTVYSFYAVSHLTTGGEGGALFCADGAERDQVAWLRRYGLHQPTFRTPDGDLNPASDVPLAGFNFAMSDVEAAMGIEQLRHAQLVVSRCRENGDYYDRALARVAGIDVVQRTPGTVAGYWVYTLLAARRAELMDKLTQHGIGCQRLHLRNDRYSCFHDSHCELPGVDAFAARALSIPSGWWVGAAERERIAGIIRAGW
jgi:dTDP-4-amino-4,6-dideoxygalactose transaminase